MSSTKSSSTTKHHNKNKSKTPKSLTSELAYLPEPEVIGNLDTPTQTFAQFHSSSFPSSSSTLGIVSASVIPDHLNDLLLESIRADADAILSNPMMVSSASNAVPSSSVRSFAVPTSMISSSRGGFGGGGYGGGGFGGGCGGKNTAMWVFISIAIIIFCFLLAGIIYAIIMPQMEEESKEIDIMVKKPKSKKKVTFAESNNSPKKPKRSGLFECDESTLKAIQNQTLDDDLVVLFVADFCHFCKDLKPVAQEVATDPDVVEMCLVTQEKTSSAGKELAKTFNIRGFPSIIRLDAKTKQATVFQNARTKEAIKEFAKRK
jgi:thiol-disulfide isomerase/thioredoxin